MSDENPTPDDAGTETEEKSTGRYAAYDKTYEKFVGGVHDSKAKARAAAKDKGVKSVEIREV